MESDFSGRVIIITGGAGQVGSIVSTRWLNAGASVLVVDHRQATVDRWLTESGADKWKGRVAVLATDVTTESGANGMIEKVKIAFGQNPDTLIHLVGGFSSANVEDANAQRTWDSMIAVNLTSSFQCYRAMMPALRERNGG